MKVSDIGEFSLIERIKDKNKVKDKDIITGIGDDTAVVRNKIKGKYLLMTTDTLVENVHFSLKYARFFELGWKLLAVNLSDIAAMGGTPKYALVTLGLKGDLPVSSIDEFYRGIRALAGKYNVEVVGGDIVRTPKSLFFTMVIIGYAGKVVKRSGARPGDLIVAIGKFGGSAAALRRLKMTGRKGKGIKAHLMPVPMLKEGLSAARVATSMIDNSDGLARCLIEICRASKVGARVYLNKISLAAGAALKHAFDGGEDYNLVLTVPKIKAKKIIGGRVIGEITKGNKILTVSNSGRISKMIDKGYQQI